MTVIPGNGQAATLLINGQLSLATSASIWRGTNLGVNAPGTANSANILLSPTNTAAQGGIPGLSAANVLSGGGAPAGNASISILRGGFGDTSATGLGTQLVTYDFDKGIRLLDPNTEYTTTLVDGSIVTDNVKIDGSAITLTAATTANVLWLKDGSTLAGAGTLNLTNGTVLVTGTANTITGHLAAPGGVSYVFGGPGDLTVSTALSSVSALQKVGAGTLTLNAANTYGGATILAGGIVNVGNASAFSTGSVTFQGGRNSQYQWCPPHHHQCTFARRQRPRRRREHEGRRCAKHHLQQHREPERRVA